MKAQLISITKPLGELGHLSPEEFIAYQARVSSPQNQHKHETSGRLLEYCLKKGHWSVFDMVDVTFEIETSRAIMAQVLRHWSFRFQEFSQRYSAVTKLDFSHVEARSKHEGGNRQGSAWRDETATSLLVSGCESAAEFYDEAIAAGVAPECARMVLPLATPTRAYMKGSVRSWVTYFWQRLDAHAQKEHRDLASLMFTQFREHFPLIGDIVSGGRMVYLTEDEQAILDTHKA